MQDLALPDTLEWEDIVAELCSTAREACSFGADWLFTDDPSTRHANFENLARRHRQSATPYHRSP